MDGFHQFSTGNRKKFIDQTKKKKQVTILRPNERNSGKSVILQKNIRAFLSRVNLNRFLLSHSHENSQYTQAILNNLRKSCQSPDKKQFNNILKLAISTSVSFNNQDFNSHLAAYSCSMDQIFTILQKQQQFYWMIRILPLSQIGVIKSLSRQNQVILHRCLTESPLNLFHILIHQKNNLKMIEEIINFTALYDCKEMPTQLQSEANGLKICYKKLKSVLMHKTISQLGQFPYFILSFMKIILNGLYIQEQLYLMKIYKIDPLLMKTQNDLLDETLKQKEQWESFIDYIDITSQFYISAIIHFVNTQQLQKSLRVSCFLTIVLKILPPTYPLYLNFQVIMKSIKNICNIYKHSQFQFTGDQQNLVLALFNILKNRFFQMTDKQFVDFIKRQKQSIQDLFKNKLIKTIYRLICGTVHGHRANSCTSLTIKSAIGLLQSIYNKIFRTSILQTKIFSDDILSKRLLQINNAKSDNQVSNFCKQFPFVFSLQNRVQMFNKILTETRYINYGNQDYHFKNVRVRRGLQFQDAFNQLYKLNLRGHLRVVFIDQFGEKQQGHDAGGLTKQLINRVLKDAFSKKFGLFIANSSEQLLPHPQKSEIDGGIISEFYQFLGKIIGKSLYEGITIGPKFSGPFLNAIIGKKNNFDDLSKIDKQLYESLSYIKKMKQDASQLCLTFAYRDEMLKKNVNLKYEGYKIQVTNENKLEYINLLADYKVNKLIRKQSRHIRKGLESMINPEWLHLFNYQQLNYLISGTGQIHIEQLKNYTRYVGYQKNDQTIKIFWRVVQKFDQKTKSNLLSFVTSCPRPSFLGFRYLNPPFTIAKTTLGIQKLPVSHTCSNILELPDYKNEQKLYKKLLQAINSNSGFGIA